MRRRIGDDATYPIEQCTNDKTSPGQTFLFLPDEVVKQLLLDREEWGHLLYSLTLTINTKFAWKEAFDASSDGRVDIRLLFGDTSGANDTDHSIIAFEDRDQRVVAEVGSDNSEVGRCWEGRFAVQSLDGGDSQV